MSGLRHWDVKMSPKEREEWNNRPMGKVRCFDLCERCNEMKEDVEKRESIYLAKPVLSCLHCFDTFIKSISAPSEFGYFED